MKGLKDFRRSLNRDRASNGRPAPAAPNTLQNVRGAVSIQPPKMVIKAIQDYRSRAPQELSFHKGDFFHVISEPGANADWFEACNPITNARGLVPANCFEVLGKTARPGLAGAGGGAGGAGPSSQHRPMAGPSSVPAASGASSLQQQTPAQRQAGAAITAKGGGGVYATVRYDFQSEREDELGAFAGEPVIIMAQSNFEWFVAKPIGRLGGPGLIPVAFVELKDLATNQPVEDIEELINSGAIPPVEEWKQMTAEYKKNTIPLGRFDFASNTSSSGSGSSQTATPHQEVSPSLPPKDERWGHEAQQQQQHLYQQQGPSEGQGPYDAQLQDDAAVAEAMASDLPAGMPPGELLPAGVIAHAIVDSFHYEQGDYWFRIQARHVAGVSETGPEPLPDTLIAPEGEERDLILYRLYEDFYKFQIQLLDHFPREAGREVDESGRQSERILPLMPGPLDAVDDYITAQRRGDLDQYVTELIALPEYILRSELLRYFFEPRPGDHCTTHPQNGAPQLQASSSSAAVDATTAAAAYLMEGDRLEEMESPNPATMGATPASGQSNGTSKYAEDQPVGQHSRSGSGGSRSNGGRGGGGGGGSSSGGHGSGNRAHPQSGDLSNRMDSLSMDARSSGHSGSNSRSSGPGGAHAGNGPTNSSTSNLHPGSQRMQRNPSSTTVNSHDSSKMSGTTSARASGGASAAPSAASPSFIKIKIFHRASDDLVAIRVPPNVTHNALLDKVRERLGADIHVLRYRDANPEPGASGMVRMHDDEDLREWLASGAKLNLYADRS